LRRRRETWRIIRPRTISSGAGLQLRAGWSKNFSGAPIASFPGVNPLTLPTSPIKKFANALVQVPGALADDAVSSNQSGLEIPLFLGLAQIYNDSAPPPPIDFDRREDALVMASIVQRIRMAAEVPLETDGSEDDGEIPK
jgi:hypothetical protein